MPWPLRPGCHRGLECHMNLATKFCDRHVRGDAAPWIYLPFETPRGLESRCQPMQSRTKPSVSLRESFASKPITLPWPYRPASISMATKTIASLHYASMSGYRTTDKSCRLEPTLYVAWGYVHPKVKVSVTDGAPPRSAC